MRLSNAILCRQDLLRHGERRANFPKRFQLDLCRCLSRASDARLRAKAFGGVQRSEHKCTQDLGRRDLRV